MLTNGGWCVLVEGQIAEVCYFFSILHLDRQSVGYLNRALSEFFLILTTQTCWLWVIDFSSRKLRTRWYAPGISYSIRSSIFREHSPVGEELEATSLSEEIRDNFLIFWWIYRGGCHETNLRDMIERTRDEAA